MHPKPTSVAIGREIIVTFQDRITGDAHEVGVYAHRSEARQAARDAAGHGCRDTTIDGSGIRWEGQFGRAWLDT